MEVLEIEALALIAFARVRHLDTSRFSDLHDDSNCPI
jgi:hypothetical protein